MWGEKLTTHCRRAANTGVVGVAGNPGYFQHPKTNYFALSLYGDEWAVATVILGALLAMAMVGASYLVRDERLINLIWDMGGDES